MQNKNKFLYFTSFLVLLLLLTIFSGKLYKAFNEDFLLFDSIKALKQKGHKASLSVNTLGDAAIIKHHDFMVTYDFESYNFESKIQNINSQDGNINHLKPWTNLVFFYDIINFYSPTLTATLENNAVYIKSQLEKDLVFNYSNLKPSTTFTIEEGHNALQNILKILLEDKNFKESTFDWENASKSKYSQAFINYDFELKDNPTDFFQVIYQELLNTFTRDSVITVNFQLNNTRLEEIIIEGSLNYKRFDALEKFQWRIIFS